jgi:hypothetical protein
MRTELFVYTEQNLASGKQSRGPIDGWRDERCPTVMVGYFEKNEVQCTSSLTADNTNIPIQVPFDSM